MSGLVVNSFTTNGTLTIPNYKDGSLKVYLYGANGDARSYDVIGGGGAYITGTSLFNFSGKTVTINVDNRATYNRAAIQYPSGTDIIVAGGGGGSSYPGNGGNGGGSPIGGSDSGIGGGGGIYYGGSNGGSASGTGGGVAGGGGAASGGNGGTGGGTGKSGTAGDVAIGGAGGSGGAGTGRRPRYPPGNDGGSGGSGWYGGGGGGGGTGGSSSNTDGGGGGGGGGGSSFYNSTYFTSVLSIGGSAGTQGGNGTTYYPTGTNTGLSLVVITYNLPYYEPTTGTATIKLYRPLTLIGTLQTPAKYYQVPVLNDGAIFFFKDYASGTIAKNLNLIGSLEGARNWSGVTFSAANTCLAIVPFSPTNYVLSASPLIRDEIIIWNPANPTSGVISAIMRSQFILLTNSVTSRYSLTSTNYTPGSIIIIKNISGNSQNIITDVTFIENTAQQTSPQVQPLGFQIPANNCYIIGRGASNFFFIAVSNFTYSGLAFTASDCKTVLQFTTATGTPRPTLIKGINIITTQAASTQASYTLPALQPEESGSLIIIKDGGGNAATASPITIVPPSGYTIESTTNSLNLISPWSAVWLMFNSPSNIIVTNSIEYTYYTVGAANFRGTARGILVDSSRNIYIQDRFGLLKFTYTQAINNTTPSIKPFASGFYFSILYNIGIDSFNNIYIYTTNGYIVKYTPTLSVSSALLQIDGNLITPTNSIGLYSSKYYVLSDSNLYIFNQSLLTFYTPPYPNPFPQSNIINYTKLPVGGYGLALDSSGNIYISTGVPSIVIYDSLGIPVPNSTINLDTIGYGIALDSNRNIYVACMTKILIYTSSGTLIKTIPDFSNATGVAVDSAGAIYIANGANVVIIPRPNYSLINYCTTN